MDSAQPVVSIFCLSYNHEPYIRDCLDGFVMQKTTFPFEVIVHDDASTDHTQDIIREYAEKYPDIIVPIFQTVNQHQANTPIVPNYILPKVRGRYVAICEGDDYWTDKDKLQLQVDMMERHPECHFCVCGVQEVALNKKPLGIRHPSIKIEDEIIEPNDFIIYASRYSFQTSSYLMRYDDWVKFICDPPEFKKRTDMGDIAYLLYFGSLGKTAFINRDMSCYRRGAPDSFSARRYLWTEEQRVKHFEKQISVWELFDEFSNKRFNETCEKKISELLFGYEILREKAIDLINKKNRVYFDHYRTEKKAFVLSACIFRKTMKKQYLRIMKKREEQRSASWNSR